MKNKILLWTLLISFPFCCLINPSSLAAKNLAVFENSNYTSLNTGCFGEYDSWKESFIALGHNLTTFSGRTATAFTNALAGKDALLIPTLDRDRLIPDLNAAAINAIKDYVKAGGLIIVQANEFDIGNTQFMNTISGSSISSRGASGANSSLNTTGAAGTPFAGGANQLQNRLSTERLTGTFPLGTKSIYTDNSGNPTVAILPVSKGNIVYIGWDYFNGGPGCIGEDANWNSVLDNSLNVQQNVVCSITGLSTSTPVCNGNNATFMVTFTTTGTANSGTIEVLDGTAVVGSGLASPISVTIDGPTSASTKTLTVRYQNNTSCSGTVNVAIPTCVSGLTYDANNELMFGDPCRCTDPRNCDFNNSILFHDTLTINGPTGLTITAAAGATNFYSAVSCFGGSLTVIPTGTAIPESVIAPGTYKIEFWRPSGILPTLSVNVNGTPMTVPADTFQPLCNVETCREEPIPTMSEWGLMIFGLLVLNLGLFFVRKQEMI